MTPKASVLLPVRDAEATLEMCLASIARQREPAFSCVVVDDGSTDGSLAIARRFASRDRRFAVLAEPPRGLVAALMRGLAACRAPVVVRMDADDLMHADRLAMQLAALEADPGLAAVGCHVELFPRAALTAGMLAYEAWLNAIRSPEDVAREAYIECPLAHPTLAVRREVLLELGYRDAGWPEDWDLLLRMLSRGMRVGVVAERLHRWRDGPDRLSRRHPRYRPEAFVACRAHYLAGGFLRPAPRYVLWGYGDTGKSLRRALAAHGKEPAAIVELHPGRLGQRIFGAPVVPPEWLRDTRELPLLVSVAGARARAEIRQSLAAMGRREGIDYLCCA